MRHGREMCLELMGIEPGVGCPAMLAEVKRWCTEEPDECVCPSCLPLAFAPFSFSHSNLSCKLLGHAGIWRELKPVGISSVTTGEHAHNRMVFKPVLQADAVFLVQIDSCRFAGVSEVLAGLPITTRLGKSVCPPAGSVGLYVVHLRLTWPWRKWTEGIFDHVAMFGTMEMNVLEVGPLWRSLALVCLLPYQGCRPFARMAVYENGRRYNVPNILEEGYRYVFYFYLIVTALPASPEFENPSGWYWRGRLMR